MEADSLPTIDPPFDIVIEAPFRVALEWPLDAPPPYRTALRMPDIPWPARATPDPRPTLEAAQPVEPPVAPPRSLRRLAPLIAVVAGLILIGIALLPR
jgi:hypothetical protein